MTTLSSFLHTTPGIRISTSSARLVTRATALPTDNYDGWDHDAYRVKITYRGREMKLAYRKGIGHHGSPPQLDEVLHAVRSDAQAADETFEDWCANFGLDTDSRKAYAMWEACKEQAKKARHLFGDQYDDFMQTEED